MRTSRLLLRRTAADWPLVASVFVSVLLAATLVAAAPIYADAAARGGLAARLAGAPVTEAGVEVATRVDADDYAAVDERVRAELADVSGTVRRAAESDPLVLRGETRTLLAFVEGALEASHVVAGRRPVGPGEVAVTSAGVAAGGIAVGAELRLEPVGTGTTVVVRVVGELEPADPEAPVWWRDELLVEGERGVDFLTVGPLLMTQDAFLATATDFRAAWRAVPDAAALPIDDVGAVRERLAGLEERLNETAARARSFTVVSGLGAILADVERSLVVARSGVLVPFLQLALLAGYGLLFSASLLAGRREGERELLLARGADRGALAVVGALEVLAVCLPAALAAPWLAAASLSALDAAGPLASADLELEPALGVVAVVFAFATVAACAAVFALATFRHRPAARAAGGGGRLQRAGLDLAVLAAALVVLWQVRRYGSPVLTAAGGELRVDPVLVAAPVLGLLAGAVLASRVLPAAGGLAQRAAGRSRGPVFAIASARLARAAREYGRPTLLLILALAIGTFAASYAATWTDVQAGRAALQAGADVSVVPSRRTGAFPHVGLATAYEALPGVRAVTPLAREDFAVPGLARTAELVALDAADAAHVQADRAALAELALRRPAGGGMPLPEDAAAVTLAATATLKPPPPQAAVPERPPGVIGIFAPEPATYAQIAPELALVVSDGSGLLRRLGPEPLAGNGEPGVLEFDLAPAGARPEPPLVLVALELSLTAPVVIAGELAVEISAPQLDLPVRGWRVTASSLPSPVTRSGAVAEPAARGIRLLVETGATLSRRTSLVVAAAPSPAAPPAAIAAVAGAGLLADLDARVGDVLELDAGGIRRPFELVAALKTFPTVSRGEGGHFLAVDLATLAAWEYAHRLGMVAEDGWLLDTEADGGAVAAQLAEPPFESEAVVAERRLEADLVNDPLAVATGGALWLGFGAAALVAAVGFVLAAAARARSSALDLAVLRTLGLGRRGVRRTLLLESAVVLAVGLVLGLAVGLLLARLVLPTVAFTDTGDPPVPAADVRTPWTTVAGLCLALAAGLGAAAFLVARRAGRLPIAAVLRAGGVR